MMMNPVWSVLLGILLCSARAHSSDAPRVVAPPLKSEAGKAVILTVPEIFSGPHLQDFGKLPRRVHEYGTPALHVKCSGADVRHFAWRGSMEGVRVDPLPFTGAHMRRHHQSIQVKLSGLFCDSVGEDAISIAPRAIVELSHSTIIGNYRRKRGGVESPGQDKLVQIDGATVTIESCDFFHGARAIRAKANTNLIVRNCRFITCKDCVTGSAEANPDKSRPYDNGQPGPSSITLINCEAWDCGNLALAYPGSRFILINCRVHHSRMAREEGGRILITP